MALFATSGGSEIGKTAEKLMPFLPGTPKIVGAEAAAEWAKGIIG